MKIIQIHLFNVKHRPLLNGLKLNFVDPSTEDIQPNILIGTNGSGKSQLLETIAEIFLHLDRTYRKVNQVPIPQATVYFEIVYTFIYRKKHVIVTVTNTEQFKEPLLAVTDIDGVEVTVTPTNITNFLPSKIIGYTSGDNETLSLPFTDYYDEYASYTGSRALEGKDKILADYDPRFYLMDYNTNIGVLISNLILGDRKSVDNLINHVGIKKLNSFQIVIQTKHTAAPAGKGVKLTQELDNWIKQLCNAATCFQYFKSENKYVLDFHINSVTRKALRHFFKSPIEFYTVLYKIELLNNLIIKDAYLKEIKKQRGLRKLIIKPPTVPEQDKVLSYAEVKLELLSGDIINYINLSDGEHQYLNIFGTVLITPFENALYLLDEPETHFNPKWRREFISILTDLTKGRKQDFFITSHSPFIVADSKREQVFIFKRQEKNVLDVELPVEETYGSDSDFILKIAFDLNSSLAKNSYDEIRELSQSSDLELIESKISEFGDSAEKLFLFKRLKELKSKTD